jgi:uncharacterized protein YllA (UPF0747 family)
MENFHPVMVPANRLEHGASRPSSVERLLARLLARAFKTFPETHFKRPLVRAAREAIRMTERTGFALLLLPELFAELAVREMLRAEYLRLGRI